MPPHEDDWPQLRAVIMAVLGEDGQHLYLSTYCVHSLHIQCRVTCKICEAQCLCPCHK